MKMSSLCSGRGGGSSARIERQRELINSEELYRRILVGFG